MQGTSVQQYGCSLRCSKSCSEFGHVSYRVRARAWRAVLLRWPLPNRLFRFVFECGVSRGKCGAALFIIRLTRRSLIGAVILDVRFLKRFFFPVRRKRLAPRSASPPAAGGGRARPPRRSGSRLGRRASVSTLLRIYMRGVPSEEFRTSEEYIPYIPYIPKVYQIYP